MTHLLCYSLKSENQIFEKGLRIREISRKKVFDRKIFQDGNFEKCPNPCKSIGSNAELALIPFLACFTVFKKYIQVSF